MYDYEGIATVDIRECHPVEGQVDGQTFYTHFKYNMEKDQKQNFHGKIDETIISEVEPHETGTHIYSEGSALIEGRKGACTTIVNKNGKHFVETRSLTKDQGKNSFRAELEGIYLGTKTEAGGGNSDKEWKFWTDSKSAIVQCEKRYFNTGDMMAPEADIILAFRHQMHVHGKIPFPPC